MPKFEVVRLSGLPPHHTEPFYKLVVDGKCYYDEFCKEMEKAGNQQQALDKIQAILVFMSRGTDVPKKWFQELKHRSKDDPHKDYEIRSGRLRIYLFEDEEGKIIVLGELKKGKKTQDKAIKKMRALKLAYFATKE